MVDYSASVKRPFLDIKNLIIGILLSILPVVRWFAFGYILECTGLSKKKVPINKSPVWTDWLDLFVRGLLATVIYILYFLPAIVIGVISIASFLGILISTVGWTALLTGDSMAISQAISAEWAKFGGAIIAAMPFLFIAGILALLAAYVSPMALLNYVNFNNFSKAFAFSDVFKKAFTGKYFVVWLVALLISIGVGLVLGWIPWVGEPAAYFIGGVIGFTLYGQIYKELSGKKA
ncbi:MAG: DUF4013 domain-containing protein [Candidatus Nanoarchaeia archaeon]